MIAFSVAVTLASAMITFVPFGFWAFRWRSFSSSTTSAPSFLRAWVWAWTDLLPRTQPPGKAIFASPARARSGPSVRIDARSLPTWSWWMFVSLIFLVSIKAW